MLKTIQGLPNTVLIYMKSKEQFEEMKVMTKLKVLVAFVVVSLCAYLLLTCSLKSMFHKPLEDIHVIGDFKNEKLKPVQKLVYGTGIIQTLQKTLDHVGIINLAGPRKELNPHLGNQKVPDRNQSVLKRVLKNDVAANIDPNVAGNNVQEKLHGHVNPHDFNYIINEPDKCKNKDGSENNVFLIVLICSVDLNFENRNAIRTSWGSPTEQDGNVIITMFMLAKRMDKRIQNLVLKESAQYHDIVMEDFLDTYKNLTLKTIMGMKWVSTFCPQAKFVMKTDDDMYVSYANIIDLIGTSERTNFAMGKVIKETPIRNPSSKWYVSKNAYPAQFYPPFLSGSGYIVSGDVAPRVYATSLNTPYLPVEDVYFAICLEKLHIVPKHRRGFNNRRIEYTFCRYKYIMTTHMVTRVEKKRFWDDQTTNDEICLFAFLMAKMYMCSFLALFVLVFGLILTAFMKYFKQRRIRSQTASDLMQLPFL